MADEEIRPEVYYIPENFDDAGGVLGGHFSTRNAIEMVVLCGPLGIVEYKVFFELLHVGLQFGLITMMFTIGTFSGFGRLWYRWREFISNTYGIYSIYSKTA